MNIPSLHSKFFLRDFDINKIFLNNRECHYSENENSYIIVNKEKNSRMIVELGKIIEGFGEVKLDNNNDLIIGKHCIPTGENIHPTAKAIFTGKATISNNCKKYNKAIINLNGDKWIKHTIGESLNGYGESYLDRYDNICFPERDLSIKTYKWQKEMTIMVTKQRTANGYRAYFNINDSDVDITQKSIGIKGVFYPSKNANKPALFSEIKEYRHQDGTIYHKYLTTVALWKKPNGKYSTFARTLEDAEKEMFVNEQINIIRKTDNFARNINFNPIYVYKLLNSMIEVTTDIISYSKNTLTMHLNTIHKAVAEKRSLAIKENIELTDRDIFEMLMDTRLDENPNITLQDVMNDCLLKRKHINDTTWKPMGVMNRDFS